MTAQEIFDRVATHAHAQGCKAVDENGACLYRTRDGLKCFIGCLIADGNYNPRMEDKNLEELLEKFPAIDHLSQHAELLSDLQDVHDNSEPYFWPNKLLTVAVEHSLSPSIITKLWGEA